MQRTYPALGAAIAAALAIAAWPSSGQTAAAPASTLDALHTMSDAAAIVFTGTVAAVRRPAAPDGTPGNVVEIVFSVADAVRGISSPTYTMREWAGLWTAGEQPLRVGLCYLMLLHAPNTAGLTSPIGGSDGAIPIRGTGPAATPDGPGPTPARSTSVSDPAASAASPAASPAVVDLGWVATRVAAPVLYASPHSVTANPITVHASARSNEAAPTRPSEHAPALPPVLRATPYDSVLQHLRRWEADRAVRP